MHKVKLLKDIGEHRKGDTVEVDDARKEYWQRVGVIGGKEKKEVADEPEKKTDAAPTSKASNTAPTKKASDTKPVSKAKDITTASAKKK